MDTAPWVEKRKSLRVRSALPVYYGCIGNSSHGNGLTRDVSEYGLRMTTEGFLPKFSKILLKLTLKPDKLLELNAQVKWTQQSGYSLRYEAGLEFNEVSADARRSLADYVYSHR